MKPFGVCLAMDHKYKEEKYIIKAKMLFAKYTLTGEKNGFFCKNKMGQTRL